MANRTTNSVNAWEDTVASAMDATTLTLLVNDAAALIVPCYLVLEPENDASREYVYVESKLSNTLTIASGERYLAGSAQGSGLTHAAGVIVRHAPVAQHHTDLNDRIDAHTHTGGSDGTQLDHGGLAGLADDDHTQYLDTTRHAAVDHDALVTPPVVADFGDIKMSAAASPPSLWLACDGAAISRTTYADLFTAIGTAYGVGDGSTTFNVPDMRQRFPLGKAASGTGSALGASGGAIDHGHGTDFLITTADLHTHGFSDTSSSAGSHTHTVSGPSDLDPFGSGAFDAAGQFHTHTTGSGGSHSHTVSGTTDNDSHNHSINGTTDSQNPPYLAVNYFIYAGV